MIPQPTPSFGAAQVTSIVDVTLTLDTLAYAAGDVLADTQAVTDVFRAIDLGGILQSVEVFSLDDISDDFHLFILDNNVSLGTENSAPNISDTDALAIIAKVSVAAADYADLGGVRVAHLGGLGRIVRPAAGTTTLYLAALNGVGTPTHTANGIKLRLGLVLD